MSMEMNADDKLGIALSLLTEQQQHAYDKQTDCSCPKCGTSGFDGYCSQCKFSGEPEDGINWYECQCDACKKSRQQQAVLST